MIGWLKRHRRGLIVSVLGVAAFLAVFRPEIYGDAHTLNQGVVVEVPWCGPSGFEWRGTVGWFACGD